MRPAALLLLCLTTPVAAQNGGALRPAASPEEVGFSTSRLARIDSMVNDLIAQKKIPGAVVYIARHGRVAYHMILTDQLPTMEADLGLGFGLETEANDYQSPRSIGSFFWGGAFATTYWADPKEGLVALIYTNMYNNRTINYADRFTTYTYAAMEK